MATQWAAGMKAYFYAHRRNPDEVREAMQKAVEQLDRREMDQTLPQLRQENQDLLKNLERSLALLKQLQQQEKLDALGTRAEELKARQDELNRQHAEAAKTHSADAKAAQARATQQQEAAARTEQLASDVQQAAQQAEDTESRKALEQAAQDLRQQAEAPQQAAAQQSAQQQDAQAAKSGQQASAALQQAAFDREPRILEIEICYVERFHLSGCVFEGPVQ